MTYFNNFSLAVSLISAMGAAPIIMAAENDQVDAARARLQAISASQGAAFSQAEAALNAAVDNPAAATTARQALDKASVVRGSDGWLYTLNDVHHHAAGPFWGDHAATAAVSSRHADPLPAISDFAQQVRKAGARLLVIPIPSKVLMHGEHLDPALANWRDPTRDAFISALREAEVEVIDLYDHLKGLKEEGTPAHLRGDAHWSPQAVELCAQLIRAAVADEAWIADLAVETVSREARSMEVQGDLAGRIAGERESIAINQVRLNGASMVVDPQSPIVLLGDSHGLVYGHKDLLSSDAGLADHLAAQFAIAIDVTSVMGSGANASRIALARRRDSLAGKKLLVWVFAEREFTRSTSGWPPVPVVR